MNQIVNFKNILLLNKGEVKTMLEPDQALDLKILKDSWSRSSIPQLTEILDYNKEEEENSN